ncbi:MAG: HipA N-terminal domain-containing protein [Clostridium sp.]
MMEEVFRTAYVYVRNVFAGTLCETEDRVYSFAYDKEYIGNENASAVSLTLPLTKENVEQFKNIISFFDGLIPEGWLLGW